MLSAAPPHPAHTHARACVRADGKVLMLADGSANFAKAIGAELDLTDKGLGLRSRRCVGIWDCARGAGSGFCSRAPPAHVRAAHTHPPTSPHPPTHPPPRACRYALLADDGVVKVLNLEEGGAFTVSSAEDILAAL